MNRIQDQMQDIDAEARRWVVCLSSVDRTAGDIKTFEAWAAADPRHRESYDEARRVWSGVEQLSHLRQSVHIDDLERFAVANDLPENDLSDSAGRFRRVLRRPLRLAGGLAAAAAVFLAIVVADQSGLNWGSGADYETAVAEIRDIALSDGSIITLGARSEIDVDFTETERHVTLAAGEAFFSVTRDASRPFYVTAGDTVVRVVGTKFDIRLGADRVRVAVAEGVVEVMVRGDLSLIEPSGKPVSKTILTAGQQVVATGGHQLEPVREVSQAVPGAWREGRLFYEGATLLEVISDANRYYDGHIDIASEGVGALRITGSFQTARIDQMLASLEQVLPVEVERGSSGRVILRGRP